MWNNVAATVFGVAHGLGKHDEAINEDEFKSILKVGIGKMTLVYFC